ncbi:MAG: hypothetical protein AB7O47_01720 [Flavobacteriales bacterium]
MKNYIKIVAASTLTLMLVVAGSVNAQNRPMKAHPAKGPQSMQNAKHQSMVHAQKVLKRTHYVIVKAKIAVAKNKNYTGDLAKAVAHQKQAKKMFAMKNPHRAILHSKQARMYAFKSLQANKAGTDVDQSYQFNKEENALAGPEDKSLNLEKELEQSTFDDKMVTDKEMTEMEVLETAPENYKNN